MPVRTFFLLALAASTTLACSDHDSLAPGQGRIALRLTDAPLPLDEVASIDVFIVRVEAKTQSSTDADAGQAVEGSEASSNGWREGAAGQAVQRMAFARFGGRCFHSGGVGLGRFGHGETQHKN
jgi:hypothetical protein